MTNFDATDFTRSEPYQQELAIQKTFMARVYGWMTIGLLVTAITALAVASNTALVHQIFQTGAFWILIIAWFGVGLLFGFIVKAVPAPVAAALFVVYSILTGAVLSSVLLIYTASSVASTFFVTAGMFGSMSVFGLVTKRNLDGLGHFCIMGLWGIILASIVAWFIPGQHPMTSWLISIVGVIVFTGLTAYDTQKIKQSYANGEFGSPTFVKSALLGGFILYLDFINLFLFLLRFLGNRRD